MRFVSFFLLYTVIRKTWHFIPQSCQYLTIYYGQLPSRDQLAAILISDWRLLKFEDAAREVLDDFSEDEIDTAPITTAYGTLYPVDGGGHIFGIRASKLSVTSLHPDPIRIFRLWQTFMENVNPLVKILHNPSAQKAILACSGDLANVPKNMEALMFAIYSMALTSLEKDQCLSMFGEPRDELLSKYQAATQQALINAAFLKSSDLMVLQAFVLYLLSMRQKIDPRSLWLMTGVAVRSSQR